MNHLNPARILVVDIETLGMAPPHALIEIGSIPVVLEHVAPGADIRSSVVRDLWRTELHSDLGQDMPPDNRAVHHIDPLRLRGQRPFSMDEERAKWPTITHACAHNSEFEAQWLDYGVPWICTYKVALRVFPDAPSHSNQALKYLLGIPDAPEHHPPHRALPDARVTAEILLRLLPLVSVEEMVQWTSEERVLSRCPMGKFKGEPWDRVESGYLQWILRTADMGNDVKQAAERELTRRRRGDPPETQRSPEPDKGASLLNDQDMSG